MSLSLRILSQDKVAAEFQRGCQARQWDGTPLTGLTFIPEGGLDANRTCVESPAMGVQAQHPDSLVIDIDGTFIIGFDKGALDAKLAEKRHQG